MFLKQEFHSSFLHSYLNDLLLIPAALPFILLIHKTFHLRQRESFPTGAEILFHLAVWSIICELAGPYLIGGVTSDPLDVLAYAAGGAFAWFWWNKRAQRTQVEA